MRPHTDMVPNAPRLAKRWFVGLGLLFLLTGCGLVEQGPTVCTMILRFGLVVYVKDSATGAWAASGAQMITDIGGVVVDSGTHWSSLPPNDLRADSLPLAGAPERAGVYRVRVRKEGYADWVRTGVRVTEDECHVRPVTLTARLQRVVR